LHRWLKIADREGGVDSAGPRGAGDQSAELREAHRRINLLEQEAEVMRRAVGYLSRSVNPK
jgi:transposase